MCLVGNFLIDCVMFVFENSEISFCDVYKIVVKEFLYF